VKPELKLLGKRVQDLRGEKGWSREDLAIQCSFHHTYIGQVERGEKNISFENLMRFSRAFGVTVSELLSGLEAEVLTGESRGEGRQSRRKAKSETAPLHLQALIRRLVAQRTAMDVTISMLADMASAESVGGRKPQRKRQSRRPPKAP
jgi:transcriptional regulator with XRE-family HTH domain